MMTQIIEHPLPAMTADTQVYWEAANDGRLMIQKCNDCGKPQFYPRAFCVSCLSDDIAWVEASGKGRIYTFTICHIPANPSMAERTPYIMAMIDLEEGVRMLTEIVESRHDKLSLGAPVEVVFEKLSAEISLPQFKLTEQGIRNDT